MNHSLKKIKYAGLNAYVIGELDSDADRQVAVFLHGYGASGRDLVGLHTELGLAGEGICAVFPEAPLDVHIGSPIYGKAWFEIDLMAIQSAAQRGELLNYYEQNSGRSEKARTQLAMFLSEFFKKHGNSEFILGGFSQGSMMALDLCLNYQEISPKALLLFSSTLLEPKIWPTLAEQRAHKPLQIFQSHGKHDPVLPIDLAYALRDMLKRTKHKCQFVDFAGGHEIPRAALSGAENFLKALR